MPSDRAPGRAGGDDRADLIRLRRRALRLVLVAAPAASALLAVVAAVSGTPALFAWVGLGAFTFVVAVAQVAVGSSDLRILAMAYAVAAAVASQAAPVGSVPVVVGVSAVVAILLTALMGRDRASIAVGAAVVAVYAAVLAGAVPWAAATVGVVVLLVGAGIAWAVLTGVVAVLLEGQMSYRKLFDRVPVGLYRTALSGELLDANPALAEFLGYEREQLVGMNARDLLFDPEDLDRLRDELAGGRDPLITDLRFRRADGTLIWVRDYTRAVTDEDGRLVCFEGELQDVTEARRHLEDLETLVRSKSELIGAVSHEVRTPLTAVVGFLEVLLDSPASADLEYLELLSMAAEQAHEVAGIVEDLLTAARIDNQELVIHAERFAVVDAVETALRSLAVRSDDVVVDVADDLVAEGDPGRVRQILRNLIGNAVRHGAPPIRVFGEVDDRGRVSIVVADRGEPIPGASVDRIFDAFFTGADASIQPGSIGIGLHVSRRLAHLMDGDLSHRRVGDETRFLLSLPRTDTAARVA
jgi:PAS domain S-box-containing protein